LFFINLASLLAFSVWGWVMPGLTRRGWSTERLLRAGVPLTLLIMAINISLGSLADWPYWAVLIMVGSVVSLAQPALSMTFPPALAGRALSAYNLVCFLGIFSMQWGVGLLVDALKDQGWSEVASFQGAFAVFFFCSLAALVYYLRGKSDNLQP
jgi:hypothetical protein